MIKLLYEDNNIVICEKLPGMNSQENVTDSLPDILKEQLGSEIYVLHRLDNPTGGAIIYAKNKKAAAAYSRLISENGIKKQYLTVVDGCPENENGELRHLLFRDKQKNKSYIVKRVRKGVKEAVLNYEVTDKSENMSLLKVTLVTGRTHQIRAQFSFTGCPVTGDGKYGSKNNRCGVALWSHKLEFTDPFTDKKIEATSLPPSDSYPWCLFNDKIQSLFHR